jgi:hypothetical protein
VGSVRHTNGTASLTGSDAQRPSKLEALGGFALHFQRRSAADPLALCKWSLAATTIKCILYSGWTAMTLADCGSVLVAASVATAEVAVPGRVNDATSS